MGLYEKIFKKGRASPNQTGRFEMLTGYEPVFTTYDGGIYEMALIRATIGAIATQISKLKPEVIGSCTRHGDLNKLLAYQPNEYQDTTKFLYRLATIFFAQNTAFIIPIENEFGNISGYYPVLPSNAKIVDYNGDAYIKYTFANGKQKAVEMSRVGILTNYQYKNDFFGEKNNVLDPTIQLLHIQNEGIINSVKNSAYVRFMAKINNMFSDKTMQQERDKFSEENLSEKNKSGLIMFDNKYSDVKQIISKPYNVDSGQMDFIKNNVFSYFGVNEKILQNSWTEDEWNAFYEGRIEPFGTQLSLVMSNMTFTKKEIAFGNEIMWTANRLQYASNNTKRGIVVDLFDRGLLTTNQALEIFNMAPVADGDKRFIRGEYMDVKDKGVKNDSEQI